MVIQGIGILVWLLIVPFWIGVLVLGLLHKEDAGFCLSFATGYMTMYALFQLIAFPMIILRMAFHIVFYGAAGLYLLLVVLSVFRYGRTTMRLMTEKITQIRAVSWTVYLALAAVAAQCYFYIFHKVSNADDAYYVATAATTLAWDSMYCRSPYTGIVVDRFNDRYICSPYPIFQAFLAKGTHLSAATIAHTVLPPFLVLVAYASFAAFGNMLFSEAGAAGEHSRKTQKMTGLFIAILSWIHVTSYYCMKNTGSILLIRVWQGKATLGAVIIPFLFYICYRMALYKEEETRGVLLLVIGSIAANLTSSMAIAIVPTMLGVFAILFGLIKRNWRYFFYMIIGTIPCMIMGAMNLIIQVIQR